MRHDVREDPVGHHVEIAELDAVPFAQLCFSLRPHVRVWPERGQPREPYHLDPLGTDPAPVDEHPPGARDLGIDGRIVRGGSSGGVSASWTIYLDTGWVGVIQSNYDESPLLEILGRQDQALTGQPVDPPGSGGGDG